MKLADLVTPATMVLVALVIWLKDCEPTPVPPPAPVPAKPDTKKPEPIPPPEAPAEPDPADRPWANLDDVGRSYAPMLAATYGMGWVEAAKALESGKSVAEAQQVLQDAWKEARAAKFTIWVAPRLAQVLPEGAEPKDDVDRKRIAAEWRKLAKGLGYEEKR